jgi:hypothetical protein
MLQINRKKRGSIRPPARVDKDMTPASCAPTPA